MGSLWPTRSIAEVRYFGIPDFMVVGRSQGGQDRKPAVALTLRASHIHKIPEGQSVLRALEAFAVAGAARRLGFDGLGKVWMDGGKSAKVGYVEHE